LIASGAVAATPSPTTPDTTAGAQSAGVTPNGDLPDAIQVKDPNLNIVASLRGVGKQVYDCDAGKFTFREPVAGLFTSHGIPAGIHAKGPFWASFDGSHVDGRGTGSDTGSAPSPDPVKNVPWLKLVATPTPNTTGVFSNVKFIQRIDTRGGVAPTGPCTAPSTRAIDYTANYVFWAPK
jgi:uncharacterized protein DUF3455